MKKMGVLILALFSFCAQAQMMQGNPNGAIEIKEIFDYQCVHCQKMAPVIENVVKRNHQVKLLLEPVPIINKTSIFQAAAIIVANEMSVHKAEALHYYTIQGLSLKSFYDAIHRLDLDQRILDLNMHKLWVKKILDNNIDDFKKHGGRIPTLVITTNKQSIVLVGEQSEKEINKAIKRLNDART